MPDDTKPRVKLVALLTALIVVFGTGTAVAFAAQTDSTDAGGNAATVVASDVEAEQVTMENVAVSNLTVEIDGIEDRESLLTDAIESSVGDNVEGFAVESVDLGTIESATITIENDTATIDAQLESLTLEGVEADRVTFSGSPSDAQMMQGMLMDGSLNADSTTVQELSVGTLTIEQDVADADTPADDVTEEPEDDVTDEAEVNVTEEPEDNVTEEPIENETEEPIENETEEPVDNETEEPVENVTEEPADNLTEEPIENETEKPEDNLTEEPVENVTEEPVDNETTDNLTEEPVDNETTDNITEEPIENETTDNLTEEPIENETEKPEDNLTEEPVENVTEEPVDNETTDNLTEEPVENETTDNLTEEPVENETTDNITEEPVENETTDNETVDNETETATIDFDTQTSNGTVVEVDSVTVPESGYVAIHNDSLLEGEVVGSVVGVSEYLEAGTHEDVNVTLFNVSGAEFENESLEEDQTLIAMPHQETNDNETYDFVATNGTEDGAYTMDGEAVTRAASVTVETDEPIENETTDNLTEEPIENETTDNVTEEPIENETTDNETTDDTFANETIENETTDDTFANETTDNETTDGMFANETIENETTDNETVANETASVEFEDQTSNGTVVEIANVTVPESGYVAIHDTSLFEGQVVESVIGVSEYLEAGTHENVNVTLLNVSGAEFDSESLEEGQTLIAMPHQETNDNETYDFVATNGTEDGAYTNGDDAITQDAFVNVEIGAQAEGDLNETEA